MLTNISNEQCLEKGQAKRNRLKEMIDVTAQFNPNDKSYKLFINERNNIINNLDNYIKNAMHF